MTATGASTSQLKYGTLRSRDADLSRLPVGLDLRAVRVAEGIRAALACAVIFLLSQWLHQPTLAYMALAAFFTCLCDTGGPIRLRLPRLIVFTVLGALTWAGFGLLRNYGLAVVLPLAAAGIFLNSFARVFGAASAAAGNILSIVLILALDRPLTGAEAAEIGVLFLCGGAWAILLALLVWRLHPYQQARTAQAEVWRRLSALAGDLLLLAQQDDAGATIWEEHARAHRRAVRAQIETARGAIMDAVGMRGQLSKRGAQVLLRLEAADQLFGALIALSELIETVRAPATRAAAVRMLRILRPLLAVLARAMLHDDPLRPGKLDNAVARLTAAAAGDAKLAPVAASIGGWLRSTVKLGRIEGLLPDEPANGTASQSLRAQFAAPILANLSWDSAMFRHALRTAVIAVPALALTLHWNEPFAHWFTITVVATLQPFYAATWQRALERIGGTVLGGLIAAALALVAHQPIVLAALMIPLSVIAFSLRQVSFGTFIACITPLIIVLIEFMYPGQSAWEVVLLRAGFTLAGGALAVFGWLVLWPSWEPQRLRGEMQAALAAHAAYAGAVLANLSGDSDAAAIEATRRHAGRQSNNFEASLTRALQEPHTSRHGALDAAMVVDAALRRVAGQISVIQHDAALRTGFSPETQRGWRERIASAMAAIGTAAASPGRADETMPEPVARLLRQVELIGGAISRYDGDAKPP